MNLRHCIILSLVLLVTFPRTYAQRKPDTPADRQKWMSEVRSLKHDFLVKELALTSEQQADFFPAYDEMEDRVNKLNAETRRIEREVLDDEKASDERLDDAARAAYNLKNEECKIELQYFDRFSKILTPRQIIQLKGAERRFTQQLIMHHRRLKGGDRKHP